MVTLEDCLVSHSTNYLQHFHMKKSLFDYFLSLINMTQRSVNTYFIKVYLFIHSFKVTSLVILHFWS